MRKFPLQYLCSYIQLLYPNVGGVYVSYVYVHVSMYILYIFRVHVHVSMYILYIFRVRTCTCICIILGMYMYICMCTFFKNTYLDIFEGSFPGSLSV